MSHIVNVVMILLGCFVKVVIMSNEINLYDSDNIIKSPVDILTLFGYIFVIANQCSGESDALTTHETITHQ